MPKFIFDESFNQWFSIDGSVFHCRFSVDSYQDDLFDEYKIKFHDSLQNAVIKRRAEFLSGRYCAQRVLIHMGQVETEIGIGKHRNPIWPPGIVGAISHTKTLAVSASANAEAYLGVGIDVEEVVTEKLAEQLGDKIVTDQENAIIQEALGSLELSFTLAFSLKESFFKAAYNSVRQYFDFSAVSIEHVDPEKKRVEFVVNQDLCAFFHKGKRLTGQYFFVEEGMVATLICVPF